MLHSTPQRPPKSKQTSSDHFTPTPPIKQDRLKQVVADELADATWHMDPVTLARALSRKTRRADVPPLTIDGVDNFDHYDIEIDQLDELLDNAVKALNPKYYEHLPTNPTEQEHYKPLMAFLNACVAACRSVYTESKFYKLLNFIVFNHPTRDGVRGASPLKLDGAGANGLSSKETRLWWRPPSGDRSSTIEIPVEVKAKWAELVSQAGTYCCVLTSARPLRQFSLVLGYNHTSHELRFLLFHAGGLTASPGLCLRDPKHHKNILHLFLSLLTWKTPGDAGLPEWSNDVEVFVQKGEDDQEGLRMRVEEVLYERLGVRGRGVKVSRLGPIEHQSKPSAPTTPVVNTTTWHRSLRLAEKAFKDDQEKLRAPSEFPSNSR